MTVAELIEILQKMPQDAAVIYRACSDWQAMEPDEVYLKTAEESRAEVEKRVEKYSPEKVGEQLAATWRRCTISSAIVYRGGRYCEAYHPANYPPGEEPNYVTVVCFPGN